MSTGKVRSHQGPGYLLAGALGKAANHMPYLNGGAWVEKGK